MNVEDTDHGGGGTTGVRIFYLNPSSNRCCSLMHRLGRLPHAWTGTWGIPGPDGEENGGEAPMAKSKRKVGEHLGGGGKSGGSV